MNLKSILIVLAFMSLTTFQAAADIVHFIPYHGYCETREPLFVNSIETNFFVNIDLKSFSYLRQIKLRTSYLENIDGETIEKVNLYSSDYNLNCVQDEGGESTNIDCTPLFESDIKKIEIHSTSVVRVIFNANNQAAAVLDHCRRTISPTDKNYEALKNQDFKGS